MHKYILAMEIYFQFRKKTRVCVSLLLAFPSFVSFFFMENGNGIIVKEQAWDDGKINKCVWNREKNCSTLFELRSFHVKIKVFLSNGWIKTNLCECKCPRNFTNMKIKSSAYRRFKIIKTNNSCNSLLRNATSVALKFPILTPQ